MKWRQAADKPEMTAIFLKPVAVTSANLGVVIEAGWAPKAAVCQGVAAGKVAACN
jgi:D-xylose transport system substrate-binding protein